MTISLRILNSGLVVATNLFKVFANGYDGSIVMFSVASFCLSILCFFSDALISMYILSPVAGVLLPLSWYIRMKIAFGAAKGLAFLHDAEKPVIYRDFKTSNILLDLVSILEA